MNPAKVTSLVVVASSALLIDAIGSNKISAVRKDTSAAQHAPCHSPTASKTAVSGGCTFDIECDDGNPCTADTCDLEPGQGCCSGTCVNSALPDGATGDCEDGIYCNGAEACQSGVCTAGAPVSCTASEVCNESQDACQPMCSSPADCDDGLACNGNETCNNGTGVCEPGAGQCGPPCPPIGPSYASGIDPCGGFPGRAGPVSNSPVPVPPPRGPNAPLGSSGDDYTLAPGTGYLALETLSFVGRMVEPGHLMIEFYDAEGNFVGDVFFTPADDTEIQIVGLAPPLTIPPSGYVAWGAATAVSPNVRFVLRSTETVDVGANNPDALRVNGGPTGNFMAPDPGILAFGLFGTPTSPPVGACCDPSSGTCSELLSWVCRAAGWVFMGVGSLCGGSPCGTGACCDPATGGCSENTTPVKCAGDFQGFGTSCDADRGFEPGEQNCCPQPTSSGGDHCESASVHQIQVPAMGEPPAVVTISGDNSPATSTAGNPDSCLGSPMNVESDLGWWEGVEIDACAYLRVDLCCSQPSRQASNKALYRGCPCGAPVLPGAHPARPELPTSGFDDPYCEDDNPWIQFGPLAAGQYFFPVFSGVADVLGPYQLHLTVERCALICGDGLVEGPEECDPPDGVICDSMCQFIPPPSAVLPDPSGEKTRAISFTAQSSPDPPGNKTAIRVTLLDLQNPVPPNNSCCPPPDFSAFESATCTAVGEQAGCARWLGPPITALESQDLPGIGSYRAARLQCETYYHDWGSEGLVHVIGAEIIPSSTYDVEVFAASCKGMEDTCLAVSDPVAMTTRRAGDISSPYAPDSPGQPNAIDVANAVNHFKKLTGAPKKIAAQIQPNVPDANADVNALDIGAVVDHLKLRAYPFSGPCVCPSTVPCNLTACSSASQCTGPHGLGALCVRTCSAGPSLGQPCNNNMNCGQCAGGTNATYPCDADTDCPGSTCNTGTCGPGFCRNQCRQCTPLSATATARYTPEPETVTNPSIETYGSVPGTGQPPPSGYDGDVKEVKTPLYAIGGGGDYEVGRIPEDGYSIGGPSDRGDDIFLNAGEMFLNIVDLQIPGRGLHYRFARCYKSRIQYEGPLGHNWDHSFNMRLMKQRNAQGALTGHLLLNTGTCRQDLYERKPDGTFESPIGFYTQLRQNPDESFTLRERSGMKYHFVALRSETDRLFLASITDRNENPLTFTYDSRGLLHTMTDSLGRSVTYTYDTGDRLSAVTDFTGRTVTFSYDANGNLTMVTGPAVTGTLNGNDFPDGKTEEYTYSSGFADPRLNHNLLTITRPNEVALEPDGPPVVATSYGTDPANASEFDKVLTQVYGGTNASGVAAGGRLTYFYQQLNAGADPSDLAVPRNRSTVIDRNGNVAEYDQNVLGVHIRYREYTGRVDPNDPRDTLATLIPSANPAFPPIPKLRPEDPAFFETLYDYNADAERTRTIYAEDNSVERTFDRQNPDRFQQGNVIEVRLIAGPRGGDGQGSPINDIVMTFTYEPIYNHLRAVCDPRGNDPAFVPPINPGSTGCGRYSGRSIFDYQEGNDLAALATELGTTEAQVTTLLNSAGMSLNLGDLNGDGLTAQTHGNVIRIEAPTVHLSSGGLQTIQTVLGYNSRGQPLFRIDPDGSRDEYRYYPESNPHGAGGVPADADTPDELGGYLGQVIQDTTATDNLDGQALRITTETRYDPVGNVISTLDGRGIRTEFIVNQLNQVIRTIRAADVSQSPEAGLIAFGYTVTHFYDGNDNLIRVDVENRDGNSDTNSLLTTTYTYDILDNSIEVSGEVDPAKDLVTGFRYDANQNRVRLIQPRDNGHETAYDERDLVLTMTAGANDPAVASTTAFAYDRNGNPVFATDAEDHTGDGEPEATLFSYDGFDRLVRSLDAVGNEITTAYDSAGNALGSVFRGRVGGPSPASNDSSTNTDLARGSAQYDELTLQR